MKTQASRVTSGTPAMSAAAGTARGGNDRAATGTRLVAPRYGTRAQVRRTSLQADAMILNARDWGHRRIADALGVGRSTVARWLA